MSKFIRPFDVLQFPKVHHTFQAKNKDSDELVTYRVQDIAEDCFEKTLEFMRNFHLPGELLCSSKNIAGNENATAIQVAYWKELLAERVSLACFKEGSDEIIAVNIMMVYVKGVKDEQDVFYFKLMKVAS